MTGNRLSDDLAHGAIGAAQWVPLGDGSTDRHLQAEHARLVANGHPPGRNLSG
jgi:hypothetical protein